MVFIRDDKFFAYPTGSHSKDKPYKPGQRINPEAFVRDKKLQKHKFIDICKMMESKVIVLYIYGGGVREHPSRLAGIWCPDSYEDSHIIRYLHVKYKPSEVRLLLVACPPVYSSQYYGYPARVFLDEPDDSPIFKENVQAFINSTEKIIEEGYIPTSTYYDIRFRLLFNRKEKYLPGEGYGPIYSWQGTFRTAHESQTYGTPTIWLLNRDGLILNEPFSGNLYHSEPYTIRYTIKDVDEAVQRNL